MTEEVPSEGNVPRPVPKRAAPLPRKSQVGPSFAETEESVEDLSSEIIKTVSRSSDQRVTCRRITGNHYRCNWWSPQSTAGPDHLIIAGSSVTTHRVSKSQLLHVIRTGQSLTIKPSGRT